MDDKPAQTVHAAGVALAAPRPPGDRWGDEICDQRMRELRGFLADWARMPREERGDWPGPFDRRRGFAGLALTGADVFWLAAQAIWGTTL